MEEKKWSKEKEELFNRWTKYHTKENRGIVGFQQSMEDVLDFILEEVDKARDKAKIEVLTEIFQTCYQEDSKTRELVEEKLSKLRQ